MSMWKRYGVVAGLLFIVLTRVAAGVPMIEVHDHAHADTHLTHSHDHHAHSDHNERAHPDDPLSGAHVHDHNCASHSPALISQPFALHYVACAFTGSNPSPLFLTPRPSRLFRPPLI